MGGESSEELKTFISVVGSLLHFSCAFAKVALAVVGRQARPTDATRLLPTAHFLLPPPNVRAIKYRVDKKEKRERVLLSLFAETTD